MGGERGLAKQARRPPTCAPSAPGQAESQRSRSKLLELRRPLSIKHVVEQGARIIIVLLYF